jgi:membrane protein insertase Oxa1/YidC/SpoIIIJ
MPHISQYAFFVKVLLAELGKYFALLLFTILAIRFWKNARRVSAAKKTKAYVFAVVATVIAGGIGYASFRHSMSRLYFYYGMVAFESGNVPSALSLYQTSAHYWQNADAIGGVGVCVLRLNNGDAGDQLLAAARRMRKGEGTPFEEFNQGVYDFATGKYAAAVPLLESSASDPQYEWRVTKILCMITLETNGVPLAADLMKPFAAMEVSEPDHAYINARLELAGGHTNEARMLVEKFDTTNCPPLFKVRLDNLRAQLNN